MTDTMSPSEHKSAQLDDVSFDSLKQLVGLVEYDATKDPFPVKAMDAVVFAAGNATQAAWYYQAAFGMRMVAYSGPETGRSDRKSFVLESGSARFVIEGGVALDSPLLDHHRAHGDGVTDISLEVADVDQCVSHARAQGATVLDEPHEVSDENDEIVLTRGQPRQDPILGPDPTGKAVGAHRFSSAPGSSDAHSEYWNPTNSSLKNMGMIIAGKEPNTH